MFHGITKAITGTKAMNDRFNLNSWLQKDMAHRTTLPNDPLVFSNLGLEGFEYGFSEVRKIALFSSPDYFISIFSYI